MYHTLLILLNTKPLLIPWIYWGWSLESQSVSGQVTWRVRKRLWRRWRAGATRGRGQKSSWLWEIPTKWSFVAGKIIDFWWIFLRFKYVASGKPTELWKMTVWIGESSVNDPFSIAIIYWRVSSDHSRSESDHLRCITNNDLNAVSMGFKKDSVVIVWSISGFHS